MVPSASTNASTAAGFGWERELMPPLNATPGGLPGPGCHDVKTETFFGAGIWPGATRAK